MSCREAHSGTLRSSGPGIQLHRDCLFVWIPGSRASRVPRNDGGKIALTNPKTARDELAAAVPDLGAPDAFDDLFFRAELEGLLRLFAELDGCVLGDLARELAGL